MAYKLRPDLFVLTICLILQSLYISSFVFASLNSPVSSFNSLISASSTAASAQIFQLYACYPADRDALLDVFATSSSLLHWRQEQDCCHWAGVTCGSPFNSTTSTTSNSSANPKLYSRVVGLTLAGISDASAITSSEMSQLPLAICRLSALISLNLSLNALIGPIPTCFSHNLPYLQTLILSYNLLSGSLSPLASLSLLTHLDLSYNQFTSVGSSIIFSSNLTYMNLSTNWLSGDLSAFKFHTPCSLEYLDLSQNYLSGSVVSSFIKGLSTNLRHLDLSANQLHISLTPTAFGTTPLLQHLSLDRNEQTTGDIRVLEHLQHLEILALGFVSVPAHILGSLFCKLGSLRSLSVEGAYKEDDDRTAASTVSGRVLDDKLLCEKPASVNLTSLDLLWQGYTGPFPTWIAHFARLQFLGLAGNQLEGSIPQGWQALTQLTLLSLSGDSPATPVSLSQEVQSWLFRLPLKELYLKSMGLTSQDFPCAAFSLLNHTLKGLLLSDNHISPGHSLLHCLQHHNFSLLSMLSLSKNLLALPLQPHMFPVSIKALDLSNCQLFGSLSSIGTLPLANNINLAHNNLTGSIPSDIGSTLMGAVYNSISGSFLDLSYNKLTGIIPSSIWNLTRNEYSVLILDNNHLHGVLAPSQGLRVGLVSIANNYLSKASFHNVTARGVSIANNYLSKVHFHNVSFLGFLDLSSNQLGGTLESLLGDYSLMNNLTVLVLRNNQLKGSIPSFLGTSAPSLITMDLSNNNLTGAIPPSLQHLQALRSKVPEAHLDHIFTFLSYVCLSESVQNVEFNVTYSYSRRHLDLSCNQLNGIIPDGLGALVWLNDLNLSRNQLSGHIPHSLARLASLESLDLSFNNLEGSIPSELSNLTSLEVFNVSFNPELSGRIPEGPQLETATSYEGDRKLCGQAINTNCGEQQLTSTGQEPNTLQTNLGFKERFASFIQEWIAIPGVVLGHVVGMGITIWALKRIHFYK